MNLDSVMMGRKLILYLASISVLMIVYLGPIKAFYFMLFSMPGTIIDSSPFVRSR